MEKDHLPSFAGLKFLVLILVVALAGCSRDSGLPDPDIIQSTVESGNQVYRLETTGLTEFSYTINLGTAPRDLYYVITNPGTASSGVPLPVVETVQGGVSGSVRSVNPDAAMPERTAGAEGLTGPGRALRDRVGVEEELVPLDPVGSREISIVSRGTNTLDTIDDTARDGGTIPPFNAGEDGLIDATCRAVIPGVETAFGTKNLSIWVADDCWQGADIKSFEITEPMVTAMANAFLRTGADNDIYDWITGIFGEEWGAHSNSYLIPDNDEITILLYDISHDNDPRIDEDKSPPNNKQDWYIAGFFTPKDNYRAEVIPGSNERIMFYIDAVAFALTDGGPWAITDSYPQDQISTLSHEFQHMIMYYQKAVLLSKNINSDEFTWLNEMSSLMAEDFVSDKLGIPGPRGVDPADGTGIDVLTNGGRLAAFNSSPDESLTKWGVGPAEDESILRDYAAAYSFGAFLGRNYGGASLFQKIVQSPYTSENAVINAIHETTGKTVTFPQLLQDWGAAVLLSDYTGGAAVEAGRQYNRGSWFTENGYSLGSIDLYNYVPTPYYYLPNSISSGIMEWYGYQTHQPTSNIYVLAASGATGIVQHNFTVGDGVKVTAVVKDASP